MEVPANAGWPVMAVKRWWWCNCKLGNAICRVRPPDCACFHCRTNWPQILTFCRCLDYGYSSPGGGGWKSPFFDFNSLTEACANERERCKYRSNTTFAEQCKWECSVCDISIHTSTSQGHTEYGEQVQDCETFHIPPLMSKRTIRIRDEGGWWRRRLRCCDRV